MVSQPSLEYWFPPYRQVPEQDRQAHQEGPPRTRRIHGM